MRLKRLGHRLEQLRGCALVASTKRHGDCELASLREIDFACSCDVAVLGCLKLPVHFEIVHQVLPTIAKADITDGPARETGTARHDEVNVFALSVDEFDSADFGTPSGIARATSGYVRSEQRVEAHPAA
jgi:hypothetical protein